jgi:hypothetical protein
MLFFVESPFSARDWLRFGVDLLISRFDALIIDMTPLVNNGFWQDKRSLQMVNDRIVTVHTTTQLDALLGAHSPGVVMLNLGLHRHRHRILRWAFDNQAISVEFQLGAMPGDDVPISAPARSRMFMRDPSTLLSAVRSRYARFRFRHDSPTLFFRGGTAAIARSSLRDTRTVDVHGLDFDLYRSTVQTGTETQEPFAVYLDQDMGFHSDYATNGLTSPVDPDQFYPSLNRFFTGFSTSTGLRVIVAPHPRSSVAALRARYQTAEVVEGPTAELVAHSSAVFTHASTAISFAVIARKPIVIIGTRPMVQSWFGRFIRSYERALGRTCIDIDDPPPTFDLSVDESRYSAYVRSFLSGQPDDPRRLWEIVADEIDATPIP